MQLRTSVSILCTLYRLPSAGGGGVDGQVCMAPPWYLVQRTVHEADAAVGGGQCCAGDDGTGATPDGRTAGRAPGRARRISGRAGRAGSRSASSTSLLEAATAAAAGETRSRPGEGAR